MKIEKILIKHFEWTEQEVKEKAKSIPSSYFKDEQIALDRAKFYQKEFNLDKAEFIKMLKIFPVLLKYSEESVKLKVEFYQQEFDLDKAEFIKMLKVLPTLLGYSEESVKIKAEFYQQEFNLTKAEFIKMLKVSPTLLGLSEESVKTKAEFYQQEFNLDKVEFIEMLKVLPALLGYSEESVKIKHQQIRDLNIPKSVIIKNPNILAAPTNTLKVRYLILRQVVTREEVLSKNWFMTSQDKTYARLRYLQSKNTEIKITQILQTEKNFVNVYGVESKELMKKYKLTPEAIREMYEVLGDGEIVGFTEEEKQFIDEEYGV